MQYSDQTFVYLELSILSFCGRSQSEHESEADYEPKPKRGRPSGANKGPKEMKVWSYFNTQI